MIYTKQKKHTLKYLKGLTTPKGIIPHHDLLQSFLEACKEQGWSPEADRTIYLSSNMRIMVASIYLYPAPGGGKPWPALTLCNNVMFQRTHVYGGVALCDQHRSGIPLIRLDYPKRLPPTYEIDLKESSLLIARELKEEIKTFPARIEVLKVGHYQNPDDWTKTLTLAGSAELMPWSRIGRVIDLLKSYGEPSKWDILVAFARMARIDPPTRQMYQIHEFLHKCLGI